MANNDSGGSFVTGFLIGGIIGTLVGIVLAPKSGSDTRADIADQSEIWRERAEGMAARVRDNVGPTIESVKHSLNPAVENLKERLSPTIDIPGQKFANSNDPISDQDEPKDTGVQGKSSL